MEQPWQRSADRLPLMILRLLQSLPDLTATKGSPMKTYLESADITPETVWTKSGRSGAAGHCVELAEVGGSVALRHSKDTGRGAFLFSRAEIDAFVLGAKDGDFDHLLSK